MGREYDYISQIGSLCLHKCISRCDQNPDCDDIIDEKGCKIVVIDPKNYLKDKPPKDAVVKLRAELLKILETGEVAMLYRSKYTVNLEWLDPRITFYNLLGNQKLNSLVEEEKQKIWTPSLIFDNTDENTRTTTDKESIISVKREGNFTQNTLEDLDNTYMFRGEHSQVLLKIVSSYFQFTTIKLLKATGYP